MCKIDSLKIYFHTSTNFISIRIVRFYQLKILPMIQIARLFLDRKIVESWSKSAIIVTMF